MEQFLFRGIALGASPSHENHLPLEPEIAVCHHSTGVTSKTITDWTSLCLAVVVNAVFKHSEMISGKDVTVELDERMFGRRKYHCGYLRPGQGVFGGIVWQRVLLSLVTVETRDAKTLQGLTVGWILPGTRIITDCWAGYRKLAGDARITHLTINHKLHFVDPNTGADSDTVEDTWAHVTLFHLTVGEVSAAFAEFGRVKEIPREM